VAVAIRGSTGALVEVNSETDFVARNDGFQAAVLEVAQLGLTVNSNEELASAVTSGGVNVTEMFKKLVGKIGENMSFRRMSKLSVSQGVVAGYIHNAVTDGMGKIGVLVALESSGDNEKLEVLAKKIAMHVAATNPLALSENDLDSSVVEKERAMLKAEALESGKPEAIVDKMVEGRMKKFFKESVLLTQTFVMDGERSVSKVIEDEASSINSDIKMVAFSRMSLGEGIEKKEENFAAEVAAAVASS
jgi:elongation factor Ts